MSASSASQLRGLALVHARIVLARWYDSAALLCSDRFFLHRHNLGIFEHIAYASEPLAQQAILHYTVKFLTLQSASSITPASRCTSTESTHGIMYDHQSQAPSTHNARFHARLKKALRLNRDPVLFLPDVTIYQEPRGKQS